MTRFQTWYHALPKAIRWLLTINVVIYVFWVFLFAHIPFTRDFFFQHLALHPGLPDILYEPWQLLTYNFLHLGTGQNPGLSFDSLLHIGFNMLWLYWVGRDHEDLHGANQIMALYLITGIGGGLLSVVWHGILPAAGLISPTPVVIHGASGAVFGVLMAVAVMYPHKKIGLLFIGPVRLLYLVLIVLAVDVIFRIGGDTAVAAHLGGALFGFLFVWIERRGVDLSSWAGIFFRERRRRSAPPVAQEGSLLERLEARLATRNKDSEQPSARDGGKKKTRSPMARIRSLHTGEVVSPPLENEVDRILDKISEQGMESLTDEEKRLLEEASRR